MDALLLVGVLVAREVLEPRGVVGTIAGVWIAQAPAGMAAGIVPSAHALRGRLSRALGVAGGVVALTALLLGAFLLRELLAFT